MRLYYLVYVLSHLNSIAEVKRYEVEFGRSICLVEVVNAPVAAPSWNPTLTWGSSKLILTSDPTSGN
ncbi:unnamed protein product [Schistocephalus solidus]|uniref:Secreted protein n=1 Tax=Schistocephalus solidus TaxID=70667 RepID=A0A183T416_SCHSO|nr:unnamed protein product [Schistocephalus solidus]